MRPRSSLTERLAIPARSARAGTSRSGVHAGAGQSASNSATGVASAAAIVVDTGNPWPRNGLRRMPGIATTFGLVAQALRAATGKSRMEWGPAGNRATACPAGTGAGGPWGCRSVCGGRAPTTRAGVGRRIRGTVLHLGHDAPRKDPEPGPDGRRAGARSPSDPARPPASRCSRDATGPMRRMHRRFASLHAGCAATRRSGRSSGRRRPGDRPCPSPRSGARRPIGRRWCPRSRAADPAAQGDDQRGRGAPARVWSGRAAGDMDCPRPWPIAKGVRRRRPETVRAPSGSG